jgi:hypothetical protein
MFIERSAGRIRLTRLIFVVAGLVPCLLLAGWAVHRGSAAHRNAVRAAWQAAVGLPLEVATVSHPRPGVIAATGVVVRSPAGRPLLELPAVEVESAATENRLVIRAARVDAAAASMLGSLFREWLQSDARHPRNCVIEVADVTWGDAAADGGRSESLRIECVGQGPVRAIRLVRGDGDDEIRAVRTLESEGHSIAERFEVEGRLSRPVPASVLAAVAGLPATATAAIASRATVSGDLQATHDATGWSGSATGRLDELDLGGCCAAVQARGAGAVSVSFERFAWRSGRLVDAAIVCESGPGWVEAALFDRLVIALGCRPGPALQASADTRSFDAAGCALELDGGSVTVRPAGGASGLATAMGAVLLQAPATPVAFERFAWMVSPPAATFVPADGPGAWLMSIVPDSASGTQRAMNPAPREGSRGF